MLQRTSMFAAAVVAVACAGRSTPTPPPLVEDAHCLALADTVSKYVSEDALPAAQLVGGETLRPPATIARGDSVVVDFVVFPTGFADTSSVEVIGANDPQFVREAIRFAAQNRFTPAQVSGCSIVSRYSVVIRPGGSGQR